VEHACSDLSLSLRFTLRQGDIETSRLVLEPALELGEAYMPLTFKPAVPRLIRGHFGLFENVASQVGFVKLELESRKCFINTAISIICSFSSSNHKHFVVGSITYPFVLCPVIFLGTSQADLTVEIEDFPGTRSQQLKDAIFFDQGALMILSVAPEQKLANAWTTFIFQMSEAHSDIECLIMFSTGSIKQSCSTSNKLARCESPPTLSD